MSHSSSEDNLESPVLKDPLLSRHLSSSERRSCLRNLLIRMPADMKERVEPMKEFQLQYQMLQNEYLRDIYELEKRYHEEFQEFFDARGRIVNGDFEPPPNKAKWNAKETHTKLNDFMEFYRKAQHMPDHVKGIPNFWLHIVRTSDTISKLVQEHDIHALTYLRDVQIFYDDDDSFTLEFRFEPNPFFSNSVLTKQYFLKEVADPDDTFSFDSLKIYKFVGTPILWKYSMDLTVVTVYTSKGKEKKIEQDSFFNFFSPLNVELDRLSEVDDEKREIFRAHIKIGQLFRDKIIPNAVLYFTGDCVDDESDEENGESDDENDGNIHEETKHEKNVTQLLKNILGN